MAGLPREEILARLTEAWEAAAPPDAVYQERSGVWKTVAELGDGALTALGAQAPRTPGTRPSTALRVRWRHRAGPPTRFQT